MTPATFTIAIEAPGFKVYRQTGILIEADERRSLGQVKLQVGQVSESVTITADASLLKTENSAVAQNVTVSQMNNLPILSVGGAGSNASSGFRDPFALVRSPIMMNDVAEPDPSSWNGWNE